jgi:hypothetical protein
MSIEFRCAECSTIYEVEDDLAGKTIRCRECNGLNRVSSITKQGVPILASRPALNLPNDGVSRPTKKPDPLPAKQPDLKQSPPSDVAIRYRCPFCNSSNAPVWRNYWTPTSTLVFFLVLAPFQFLLLGGLLSGLAVLLSPLLAEEVNANQKGLGLAIVFLGLVFFGVLIAFHFLSGSQLVKEARQVCPDCHVRIS